MNFRRTGERMHEFHCHKKFIVTTLSWMGQLGTSSLHKLILNQTPRWIANSLSFWIRSEEQIDERVQDCECGRQQSGIINVWWKKSKRNKSKIKVCEWLEKCWKELHRKGIVQWRSNHIPSYPWVRQYWVLRIHFDLVLKYRTEVIELSQFNIGQ